MLREEPQRVGLSPTKSSCESSRHKVVTWSKDTIACELAKYLGDIKRPPMTAGKTRVARGARAVGRLGRIAVG